ncbi:MAG: hypothetical protein GAK41_00935 [Burkholderia gladioli]|nr:MAG: hypothetical protein GAK41_00935 [Burkholderia gladioli]
MPGDRMHRFIIVGGGAGGLELATRLGDRDGARGKREARALIKLVALLHKSSEIR